MTTIANADGYVWPSHSVSMPIEIGEVRGTTRNVGVTGVVFDSPVRFAPGSIISFVISMRSETQAPVRLECEGVVTRDGSSKNGDYEIAATIATIRITSPQL